MAGEELSSIGSGFPDKVSGLIYLGAAYSFAFYDPSHPQLEIEMNDLKKRGFRMIVDLGLANVVR